MARVLLVIPQSDFSDAELAGTWEELLAAGHACVIASHSPGLCTGVDATTVRAALSIDDVDVSDYDAIAFIGGPGAASFFNDPSALRIARHAHDDHKVVAAICTAPVILANAGILTSRLATVLSTKAPALAKAGAHYRNAPIVAASDIVTARGPGDAHAFGRAVARAVASRVLN